MEVKQIYNKNMLSLRKKPGIVAIVDAPEPRLADGENAVDVLLNFYRDLGWNEVDTLDPRRVKTTKEVYDNLHNLMRENHPCGVGVAMAMMDKGPSVDRVQANKVILSEGWILPAESTGDSQITRCPSCHFFNRENKFDQL